MDNESPPAAVVDVRGLHKQYDSDAGPHAVLRDINLTLRGGEFVALMGPSGSGKSTLMNILGCLDSPTRGQYWLEGQEVSALDPDRLALLRNRHIGFVFQGFNLLPRVNLIDNVALPMIYARVSRTRRVSRARELLRRMGLEAHAGRLPNQISGGQQQRVAIARALVNSPRLLLADEPTGNLDSHTSAEIMRLFGELNREEGLTVLLITHEPDIASHAPRLIYLVDGHITYDGASAGYLQRNEMRPAERP